MSNSRSIGAAQTAMGKEIEVHRCRPSNFKCASDDAGRETNIPSAIRFGRTGIDLRDSRGTIADELLMHREHTDDSLEDNVFGWTSSIFWKMDGKPATDFYSNFALANRAFFET